MSPNLSYQLIAAPEISVIDLNPGRRVQQKIVIGLEVCQKGIILRIEPDCGKQFLGDLVRLIPIPKRDSDNRVQVTSRSALRRELGRVPEEFFCRSKVGRRPLGVHHPEDSDQLLLDRSRKCTLTLVELLDAPKGVLVLSGDIPSQSISVYDPLH